MRRDVRYEVGSRKSDLQPHIESTCIFKEYKNIKMVKIININRFERCECQCQKNLHIGQVF